MKHYVCTGNCGGESDKPKFCTAENCSKEGQPFVECDCEDGLHEEAKNSDEDEKSDEM